MLRQEAAPVESSLLPPEIGGTFDTLYPTNEQINLALFGERPQLDLPPLPQKTPNQRRNEQTGFVTMVDLVAEMTADDIRLRESAEREGMPKTRFVIVGGQPYGETTDHLMAAVGEYVRTGEMPAPHGDGISYTKQLIKQSVEAGIRPVVYAGSEVLEHPSMVEFLNKLNLTSADIATSGHDLGGIIQDLAPTYVRQQQIQKLQNDYKTIINDLENGGGQKENLDAERASFEITVTQRLVEELDEQLLKIEASIQSRLICEDKKIAKIVEAENANEQTDAIIAILPAHTQAGGDAVRRLFTDSLKDVDGLSTTLKEDSPDPSNRKVWDEATPRGMMGTARHMAKRYLGKDLDKVPRRKRVQLGLGRLVGKRLRNLWDPGKVVDGTKPVTNWTSSPDPEPVAVLMTATRGADNVKADRIRPARWGVFGPKRLLIVDGGCVTVTNPVTGMTEVHGNFDPASMPTDGNVLVATGKKNVGIVTAAIVVRRAILTSIMKFKNSQGTWNEEIKRNEKQSPILAALGSVALRVPTFEMPKSAQSRRTSDNLVGTTI